MQIRILQISHTLQLLQVTKWQRKQKSRKMVTPRNAGSNYHRRNENRSKQSRKQEATLEEKASQLSIYLLTAKSQ